MTSAPSELHAPAGRPRGLHEGSRWQHPLIRTHLAMMRTKPMGFFGLLTVVLLVFCAIAAPLIADSPTDTNPRNILQGPSAGHWFGTDMVGRDIYSRVVWGARISITIGVLAVGWGTIFAILLGTIGAMKGGMVDLVIQRIVDAWIAIPFLVFLLAAMTILEPGLWSIILVLGLGSGFSNTRVVRGAALQVLSQPYVEAASSLGAGDMRIVLSHVLPNIMAPVIVVATLAVGNVILAEAALSFLGFGIPPPTPAWGGMLSGSARDYMFLAPWMMVFPGLAISLTVFGWNMYGDALRDILDPRLRGSR